MKLSCFAFGLMLYLGSSPLLAQGQDPTNPSATASKTSSSPTATEQGNGSLSANNTMPQSNDVLFQEAVEALANDASGRAIDLLELLADRGFVHPDASYNRAVAYTRRGTSLRKHPGDLGRAAAALEETLILRPTDEAARIALTQVRSEIARRSVREGNQSVAASPSPGRALTGLLPENAWAILALLGSFALAMGLALRWWTTRSASRLTGAVTATSGAVILLIAGIATATSRHYRTTSTKAVVITSHARLLDAQGTPLPKRGKGSLDRIPEGALVYLGQQQGALQEVEWGTVRGWITVTQVRKLPHELYQ